MNAAKDPCAQSVQAAAPAAEYFPAAHATHFVMPVLAANVPAAQFCASPLHNQTQSLASTAASEASEACIIYQLVQNVRHTLHWLAALEPTSWLYVPAAHASQAALDVDPVLVLYVPAGHSVQAAADVEPVRSL